jgi:hypothetical protein
MTGVIPGRLLGIEGLEPFSAEPFVFGERSPVREETYDSDIWRRKSKKKKIRRRSRNEGRGKEGKRRYF